MAGSGQPSSGNARAISVATAGPRGLRPYRFPLPYSLRFLWSFARGRPRDMAADAPLILTGHRPRVLGDQQIPARGPFIIVANHYQRPGLLVLWAAFLISRAVAERAGQACRVRWLMTRQWERVTLLGARLPAPRASRWAFGRLAKVYDVILMPMGPGEIGGRAAAVRALEGALRAGEPVGLFPEGAFAQGQRLSEATPGSGLLLRRLSAGGVPILPVGICEEEGELHPTKSAISRGPRELTVSFGPPLTLPASPGGSRQEADRQARREVMLAIGRLLPAALGGFYQEALEREGTAREMFNE